MTDLPTHEEHVLYLLIELDQALSRKAPQWSSKQIAVARRYLASLLERIPTLIPLS